ncbi:hypothetical protein FJZ19_04420 [Candidatus Pacearchaeota archaeon]|nr:hypothetical protein [Candidatus Pacearchaeota archaeon]
MPKPQSYVLRLEGEKVICTLTLDEGRITKGDGLREGEVTLEAETTREALRVLSPVKGTLREFKRFAIPNPNKDEDKKYGTRYEEITERRLVREKTDAQLPLDMVAYMIFTLATEEGAGARDYKKYLDDLFK